MLQRASVGLLVCVCVCVCENGFRIRFESSGNINRTSVPDETSLLSLGSGPTQSDRRRISPMKMSGGPIVSSTPSLCVWIWRDLDNVFAMCACMRVREDVLTADSCRVSSPILCKDLGHNLSPLSAPPGPHLLEKSSPIPAHAELRTAPSTAECARPPPLSPFARDLHWASVRVCVCVSLFGKKRCTSVAGDSLCVGVEEEAVPDTGTTDTIFEETPRPKGREGGAGDRHARRVGTPTRAPSATSAPSEIYSRHLRSALSPSLTHPAFFPLNFKFHVCVFVSGWKSPQLCRSGTDTRMRN